MANGAMIRTRWLPWLLIFFEALYTKDENVDSDQLLSSLDERVSRELNDMLCKEFFG